MHLEGCISGARKGRSGELERGGAEEDRKKEVEEERRKKGG